MEVMHVRSDCQARIKNRILNAELSAIRRKGYGATRVACDASISDHVGTLIPDIEAAIKQGGIQRDWTAESLELFTQTVLQGAFILAKAKNGVGPALNSVDHLRRYIELLFSVDRPAHPL